MAIGHIPLTNGLKEAGIEVDNEGYIVVKNNVFTSIDVRSDDVSRALLIF